MIENTDQKKHPRNTAGCCDGSGQVHHGEGSLSFVTICPNKCALTAWDAA